MCVLIRNFVQIAAVGNYLNDFYVYDVLAMVWTGLHGTFHGVPPSPRSNFGIVGANGVIYVFGGLAFQSPGH